MRQPSSPWSDASGDQCISTGSFSGAFDRCNRNRHGGRPSGGFGGGQGWRGLSCSCAEYL